MKKTEKQQKHIIEILPAVLARTAKELRAQLQTVSSLGPWMHIDFLDNTLVTGRSVPLSAITKMKTSQKREVHLMVEHPAKYTDALIAAGVERILVHIESDGEKDAIIQRVRETPVKLGLAVLDTSLIYPVRPYLKDVDCVTVMTVKAGKSGQKFLPAMLEKIRLVHSWYPEFPIEADGGITEKTAQDAVAYGATRLAVHKTLLGAKHPSTMLATLQRMVDAVDVFVNNEE